MSWRDEAACRGYPTDWWFPENGQNADLGRAICRRCPVRGECLTHALTRPEKHGVWGGVAAKDRRRLRAQLPPVEAAAPAPRPRVVPDPTPVLFHRPLYDDWQTG